MNALMAHCDYKRLLFVGVAMNEAIMKKIDDECVQIQRRIQSERMWEVGKRISCTESLMKPFVHSDSVFRFYSVKNQFSVLFPIRLEFYVDDNEEIMVQLAMGVQGGEFNRKLIPRRICSQTRDEIANEVGRYDPRYFNYVDTVPIWSTLNRMEQILESMTLSEKDVKELRHHIKLLRRMTEPGMNICSQRN